MFDHVGIVVNDLHIARVFYSHTLSALHYELIEDHSDSTNYGWLVYGTQDNAPFFVIAGGAPSWWAADSKPSQSPVHLALMASSTEAVDQFYHAGITHGGTDNGPPGDRGLQYYAAYLIDPDGNNVEAGFRGL